MVKMQYSVNNKEVAHIQVQQPSHSLLYLLHLFTNEQIRKAPPSADPIPYHGRAVGVSPFLEDFASDPADESLKVTDEDANGKIML